VCRAGGWGFPPPCSSDSVTTATTFGTLLGTCFSCQRLCGVCTAPQTPQPPPANPPDPDRDRTRRHPAGVLGSARHAAHGNQRRSGCHGGANLSNSSSAAAPSGGSLVEQQGSSSQHSNRTFRSYLPAGVRTYSCVHCRAHLADHQHLISKSFQGSQGRAYLFESVVNVGCGPAEERVLLTGLHAVADIYCENCKTTLGWKYEHAFEMTQKYKEGKYIIELAHMLKENYWD
ncbi:protein yippee-like 3, partial [Acipenser ruthenus]|uniref:protein yippee-like 3 n=1 Tax=Acipenser ruthenus TaxID=7906 RepID=UPI0027419734